jgi:hypothetical protein
MNSRPGEIWLADLDSLPKRILSLLSPAKILARHDLSSRTCRSPRSEDAVAEIAANPDFLLRQLDHAAGTTASGASASLTA